MDMESKNNFQDSTAIIKLSTDRIAHARRLLLSAQIEFENAIQRPDPVASVDFSCSRRSYTRNGKLRHLPLHARSAIARPNSRPRCADAGSACLSPPSTVQVSRALHLWKIIYDKETVLEIGCCVNRFQKRLMVSGSSKHGITLESFQSTLDPFYRGQSNAHHYRYYSSSLLPNND